MNLRPIGDRIVVRPELEESSTWLHEHQRRSGSAQVLAVGERVTGIQPGDRVWFNPFAGTEVRLDDELYLLLHSAELYALSTRGSFFLEQPAS